MRSRCFPDVFGSGQQRYAIGFLQEHRTKICNILEYEPKADVYGIMKLTNSQIQRSIKLFLHYLHLFSYNLSNILSFIPVRSFLIYYSVCTSMLIPALDSFKC